MSSFALAVGTLLQHEGGFVNDPADPGGATAYGISLRYLQQIGDLDGDGWLDGDLDQDGDVDVDDIRAMTREKAADLYEQQFWDRYGYSLIQDQQLATKLLCLAVHAGPRRAHLVLQRAINYSGLVKIDGIIGPMTRDAANSQPATWLLTEFKHETADFYRFLIRQRPTFMRYRRGWLNRAYC